MADKTPQIDLTKIKNVEAVSKFDKDFEEKVAKTPVRKRGTGKFQFAESELVPLPSGGRLYKDITDDKDILKGSIRVFPMTLKEEEILSTPRFLKAGIATRMILDRCIASDIEAKDILLFDSNFLLFYLRKISYGDEYEFEITCSNAVCDRKYTHKVFVSSLVFEELSKEVKEPIIVKLPHSKYTVRTILPRLYHSEDIFLKNQKRKKSTTDEDKRLLDNLLFTAQSITSPDGDEVDRDDWEEFFESITGIDTAELRDKTSFSTGVDELTGVTCPYCDSEYSGTIPIGINFFRF